MNAQQYRLGDKEKLGVIEHSARCLECERDYQWYDHMSVTPSFRRETCERGHTLVYYLSTLDSMRNAYAYRKEMNE